MHQADRDDGTGRPRRFRNFKSLFLWNDKLRFLENNKKVGATGGGGIIQWPVTVGQRFENCL